MCGIAGHFGSISDGVVARVGDAVATIRHRGPDDERVEAIEGLGAFGMCRLAIRDTSSAGMQPWWHDRFGIVFNGEIYNTAELTDQLTSRGHTFVSTSDTEVVLKAFIEYGTAAFGKLDGIFAIAIVDVEGARLHLARDEYGVKPLFVEERAGSLLFASEPKALRAMGGLRGGPDLDNLELYLRYQYVPEPLTPWAGVRRVPRGTVETYSIPRMEPVGELSFRQPTERDYSGLRDAEEWVDATEEALMQAVRRQMISDRPLGVFLSGGIDSTLVSAFASTLHPSIQAFGISVPGWDRDERTYIQEASSHLDVTLSLRELTEADFDRLADRILDTFDEPFGDYSAIPTMLVSEIASRDVRVVLSGDGGDELFGGYTRYERAFTAELFARLPGSMRRVVQRSLGRIGRGPGALAERIASEADAGGHGYASMLMIRSARDSADLLGRQDPVAQALVPRTSFGPWTPNAALDLAMRADTEQYMPADINTKVDRASMAYSLETRAPLLGAPMARLAEQMPVDVKVKGGVGKWPLKEVLRRRGFSDEFLHRPKAGFSFPMDHWLRNAVARRPDYEDALRNAPAPLDRVACGRELDLLLGGTDNGHAVWSLLMLSMWLDRE